MQNKEEFLLDLIQKRENLYEKKKTKRTIIAILLISIIFFIVFYFYFKVTGLDTLYTILLSLFCGFMYFYINAIIFSIFYKHSTEENLEIQQLKNQYNNLIHNNEHKEEHQ